MVAGDVANLAMGRPSALSGNIAEQEAQKDKSKPSAAVVPEPSQTKFPHNPSYSPEEYNISSSTVWIEHIPNNLSSINNMLLDFAKEVYNNVSGNEQVFLNTPAFQVVARNIAWYNHQAGPDSPMVFIPYEFKNKKDIVNLFIGYVAQKIV
jgi:hypothetical protein